ncbi:ENOS interacting protein [Xylariaceae sp. FL1651]|nr:ENOS interacting protein [Xylariaceae sp. FL1651]
MMYRLCKRNTSRAVFTSHERELARKAWASTSARLTRESFLAFSACRLCLETAIDPVSCTHGDIFCRECALSNILAQKKEIKRVAKARKEEEREIQERLAQQDAEAQERAIREFEMTQNGLQVQSQSASKSIHSGPNQDRDRDRGPAEEEGRRSGKRKFEMDDDELRRITADDRAKARRAINDEKAAKPTLPSFWAPTITPSSNTRDVLYEVVKKTKTHPICPASADDRPHTYSLHTLVGVRFAEEEDKQSKKTLRICPSCKKVLGNASGAMLAKPCGHVLCGSCVNKFMRPDKHHDPHASHPDELRCYVCDASLSVQDSDHQKNEKDEQKDKGRIQPGLVELRSEGTGYSGGGTNQVHKSGVAAFQC